MKVQKTHKHYEQTSFVRRCSAHSELCTGARWYTADAPANTFVCMTPEDARRIHFMLILLIALALLGLVFFTLIYPDTRIRLMDRLLKSGPATALDLVPAATTTTTHATKTDHVSERDRPRLTDLPAPTARMPYDDDASVIAFAFPLQASR